MKKTISAEVRFSIRSDRGGKRKKRSYGGRLFLAFPPSLVFTLIVLNLSAPPAPTPAVTTSADQLVVTI